MEVRKRSHVDISGIHIEGAISIDHKRYPYKRKFGSCSARRNSGQCVKRSPLQNSFVRRSLSKKMFGQTKSCSLFFNLDETKGFGMW